MTSSCEDTLVISSVDLARLEPVLTAAHHAPSAELLRDEICRAQILPQTAIPPDVVTMNSRVRVRDDATGRVNELTLVYPRDANADAGRVSVLAPIGSALLGLRTGQSIEWPLPGNRKKSVTVLELCYQPEAARDFEL